MTLQNISGSDYYGKVMWTEAGNSLDNWSELHPVPGFGWQQVDDNINEAVCDVVPEFHKKKRVVLAMGINIYYRNGSLYEPSTEFFNGDKRCLRRYPVYAIMDENRKWVTQRRKLEIPTFADCSIYSANCSQRYTYKDGKILIPLTYGYFGRVDRMVTTVLCDFDGHELTFQTQGNSLELPVGRGLLEPSITEYNSKYYMTLRAEDNRGYISVSEDGLNWSMIKTWQWENGLSLTMSTTQQHWLTIGGKLYLVYTRKSSINNNVIRWRSPLLMAEVDPDKLCLKKNTEQVVFPIRGNPKKPETVGRMGNFHPVQLSDNEAVVSVGEVFPQTTYISDIHLARIRFQIEPYLQCKTKWSTVSLC